MKLFGIRGQTCFTRIKCQKTSASILQAGCCRKKRQPENCYPQSSRAEIQMQEAIFGCDSDPVADPLFNRKKKSSSTKWHNFPSQLPADLLAKDLFSQLDDATVEENTW